MNTSDWNVIIVDDEPDNVGVLELVLKFHDAKVRIADSGANCLKLLEDQEKPTLLLVDIQMPGMSGFELLEHIRSREECNGIPVIAVTAHSMVGDEQRIQNAGFNGYIPKPVNAMSLVDEIQKILETYQW